MGAEKFFTPEFESHWILLVSVRGTVDSMVLVIFLPNFLMGLLPKTTGGVFVFSWVSNFQTLHAW